MEGTITQGKKSINYILLIAVFFEIIYPLLGTMPIPHSLVVYSRFSLTLFVIFYIITYAPSIFMIKAAKVYTLWISYVLIRNIIIGYGVWGSHIQMFLAIVPSFTTYLICLYGFRRNENLMIKIIIVALYFFVLYGMLKGGGSLTGGTSDEERLGGELVNANAIGIRASLIIFFCTILFIKKQIRIMPYLTLSILPLLAVLMSGSRTAFIMTLLVLSIFFLVDNKKTTSVIWKVALFAIVLWGVSYIMYNTSMGERMMSITTQAEDYHLVTGTAWDLMGDRGYQYYTSIPYIIDNLWFGIGMGNYINKVSGAVTVLHSEYLIQLLECGLIAFILYFFTYFIITRILLRRLKFENSYIGRNVTKLCILCMLAMLFVCFVTRVCYYGMYSCCIAYMTYQGYTKISTSK